jgi:hypothetical protein
LVHILSVYVDIWLPLYFCKSFRFHICKYCFSSIFSGTENKYMQNLILHLKSLLFACIITTCISVSHCEKLL